jgi:hypothetical protein
VVTDEPSVPETPPAPAPAQPRRRRSGRVLLVLAAILVGVLVVGGGAAFVIYDRATAIDRSTPEVVAGQFLRATLVDRDPARVSLFVCRQWSAQDAIREADPPADPKVFTMWGDYASRVSGNIADVDVNVQFSFAVGGNAGRDIQLWVLHLEKQDGWRVCDITKKGSLNP